MKLTKNGVVCTQKQGTGNFPTKRNFATVAKISYASSEIFSPVVIFPCFLLVQFLHSWLDAIKDKSYELDVNQLNFDMPSLT